jgi:[ribosomal protein S18]-alanine N-acetyltransferase
MVARPPVRVVVDLMTVDDLDAVHVIERESFSTPWPSHAYRQELESNRLAHYIVARWGDEIVGFAGIWLLVDEAHVTTFATRRTWRRQGIGERLLLALLDLAIARGAHEATLEVRPSNTPARRLYEKYGFKLMGVRPRYYSDNNEDALIMTTDSLDGRPMKKRIAELREAVSARPDIELGDDGLPVQRPRPADAGAAGAEGDGGAGQTAEAAEAAETEAAEPEAREPRIIRPSRFARRGP